jgi:hypothetical protein
MKAAKILWQIGQLILLIAIALGALAWIVWAFAAPLQWWRGVLSTWTN